MIAERQYPQLRIPLFVKDSLQQILCRKRHHPLSFAVLPGFDMYIVRATYLFKRTFALPHDFQRSFARSRFPFPKNFALLPDFEMYFVAMICPFQGILALLPGFEKYFVRTTYR